jgi:hypothetical protein
MKGMKPRLLLFGILHLIIISCNTPEKGATDIKEIRETLERYNESVIKEDGKAMVEFMYPGVFEKFSKVEMINDLEESLHNTKYDMSVKEIHIDSIYNVVNYNSIKYGLAQNSVEALFLIKRDLTIDSMERENQFNQHCSNFKRTFREINVTCNNAEKSIGVSIESKAFLIYSKEDKKWFILGDTDPEKIAKFIPIEVRRKF